MATETQSAEVTYTRVAAIALPVVLSNATVPLQGAIDTAIIGNLGSAVFLAAVTLGAALFSLIVGVFNFIQMGTSGLAAQAMGAGNQGRVMNTLLRALIMAGVVSILLFALQGPLTRAGLAFFEGSAEAEALAAVYFQIRLFGLPAELANYAILGWFTGQEMTRRLFEMQIVISLVNIVLNLTFVLGFGWGVEGVALGTVFAAYAGLALGLFRVWQRKRAIAPAAWRPEPGRLLNAAEFGPFLALNRDIFIRSILLMLSFAWVARLGSTQGDEVLAANGILMQFLHISAYALDGFAMAAETLVGQALGARSRARLRRAVIVSSVAAFGLALAFTLVATGLAGPIVRLFTNVETVREIAMAHILWGTCMPLVGVLAFQMDGVFIGAAEGRGMRNAMIASAAIFLPLSWGMTEAFGNHGLWASVALFMVIRAGFLGLLYPRLEARASPS
ncbi:MAG: MATE family efflux transporter [Pseudomonadota bacterium]